MAVIWQKGRRLFTVAAILMLLTALAHTLGQFGPPGDAAETKVVTAMQSYHIDLGPSMRPSFFDVFRTLAFTMSIMLTALGLMNLMIVSSRDTTAVLLKRVTYLNVVWVAAFTALGLGYQVLPPLICGLLILAVLVASLAAQKKG